MFAETLGVTPCFTIKSYRTTFKSDLMVFSKSRLGIWTQPRIWAWLLKTVSILTQFATLGLLQKGYTRKLDVALNQGLQTMARGPHSAREDILSTMKKW